MVLRQLTKEQAKEEVKRLVDKYNRILESGSIKRYKEEDTKAEFIEPLFEALGWDVRNTDNDDEVVREEKISKGRVDYSFRINGIPKFFLEAKALKEDLDNIKFVEQAINYAWHKGCVWAVLSDFEGVKVFNAEWKSANPLQNMFFGISCSQFLNRFDQLWLLSRESFENGTIDKEAEKWGKKAKKVPVDKQLLGDLTRFRELLTKNILKNNSSKNLTADDLDESVQRILDRLIFIRTLEDKELEAPMLQSLIRENTHKRVYKKLNELFRKIDDIYNSKLFVRHLCEDLTIDDEILEKIIIGLFKTSDNTVHYDFGVIDADVLGNIYEQYLGHILKKTEKRAKLSEGKAHRKEQGIYYTPTYVVDYIVKNTVGELAKNKKFDLDNIKILDPACGSGSFLMKAFDYLVALNKKKNGNIDQTKLDFSGASVSYGKKVEILKNNIFGVDLDPKAVEIAQLNLLLKTAEKKHRLPTLQENIKVGNSLIDDSDLAGKRAFKWEEEFKEVMDEGGFDVVIGNPPYIRIQTLQGKDVDFFNSNYQASTKNYDIYALFVEKGLLLLREGGILGFILPSKFFNADYGEGLRKVIQNNKSLHKIVDFKDYQVFEGATTYTCLLFLRKHTKNHIEYCQLEDYNKLNSTKLLSNDILSLSKIEQPTDYKDPWNFVSQEASGILNKILKIKTKLADLSTNVFQGIITGADKIYVVSITKDGLYHSKQTNKKYNFENALLHPLLKGSKHIRRYYCEDSDKYVIFPYKIIHEKAIPISEEDLQKTYPIIFSYLKENKKILEKRDSGKMKGPHWYLFSRNQNLNRFGGNKLITPSIAKNSSFTFDEENRMFVGSGGGGGGAYGIVLNDNSIYYYVQAILNSKLVSFFISKISSKFSGGFFAFNKQYIDKIPIPMASVSVKDKLSLLSKKELELNSKLEKIRSKQTDEKAHLAKEIQLLDNQIDQEVYKLYGLTKGEIEIIEENLK